MAFRKANKKIRRVRKAKPAFVEYDPPKGSYRRDVENPESFGRHVGAVN